MNMKKLFFTTAIVVFTAIGSIFAQQPVHVNGYYRSNGTYVAPHYRTSPNSTRYDNYSHHGNYNPYTGKYGTKW